MKNNKNLIFFMPFIGGGGVEKNLFIIANYLATKINKINLCTLSINKKNKFNNKIKFLIPKKDIYGNLNIRLKYLVCLFILFKFLIRNKNSVVFAFQANIYCVILCKLLNVKVIVRSNSSPLGWYHNFLKKIIYKKIISWADKVVVNSIEFKKQMDKEFNIKSKCILNPLNSKFIIKESLKGKSDIFFKTKKKTLKLINLGRYTDQKNQIIILKAAQILKRHINFKLLILGRGSEKNNMKNFIEDNSLKNFVKLKDFIDNPFRLIKESDIFILSSKYEGLPNVLLEAACLKRLIISTKCPTGPKEILSNGKGGIFFKINDYKDLALKIKYAIRNKKLMKKKVEFCYKNLHRYDYKKNLEEYHVLLKNMISSN